MTAQLRKIVLHGRLKRRFQASYTLSVSTAAEAIRALGYQIPGFLDELKKGSYEVVRGDRRTGMRLALEDVPDFKLGNADLHIIPVVRGSKNGGAVKTILGVALIGAAIFFSGGTLAAPLAASGVLSGVTYGNLAMLGLGLALTGASQLLTPDAKPEEKNQDSFTLDGPGNTSQQGTAVPLVYGETMTGSVLISAGLDVEPIPVGWDPLKGNFSAGPS